MTLQELLDELRENILHDRSDRVAGQSDRLWSDETLIRYIDEAQRKFAREGLVIRDGSTAAATQITMVANTGEYAMHESVLAVLSGKFTTDDADLRRVGHHDLNIYLPDHYPYWDPSTYQALPAGKPLAFSTDERQAVDDSNRSMTKGVLRVYPKPSSTYAGSVLQLRVVRLPIRRLTECKLNERPELPEDYHLDMLDWAAHIALRIQDVDAGFRAASQEFAASFNMKVREARRQVMRKLFAPVGHGFGQNGWSWER